MYFRFRTNIKNIVKLFGENFIKLCSANTYLAREEIRKERIHQLKAFKRKERKIHTQSGTKNYDREPTSSILLPM